MKIVAGIFLAVAAFLIYAVIAAIASSGGARVIVCVGYILGAVVLYLLAVRFWRGRPTRSSAGGTGP
jgi:hypothetical protein